MYHIAIVDKKSDRLQTLAQKTEHFFHQRKTDVTLRTYKSTEELLRSGHCFELVIFNLEAAGPACTQDARRLREEQKAGYLLLITSSREEAYEASGLEAAAYLQDCTENAKLEGSLDRILCDLKSAKKGCVRLPSTGRTGRVLFCQDIRYCEATEHKTIIHSRNASYDCRYPLKELEAQLSSRFFQCHRGYLVNLDWVRGYENGSALLLDGGQIPVARLRRKEFSQAVMAVTGKE